MTLSPRLAAIADLVPRGARVADVGCDHGYLSIALTLSGRALCIASDVREGPLSAAAENVASAGLSGQISLRLGDGLCAVRPDETDCVVIAGMGGDTVRAILEAAPWIRRAGMRLILQPQSHLADLRLWLAESGFAVEAERVVCQREHVYVILRLVFAGRVRTDALTPYFSPALLALPAKERAPYLDRLLRELQKRRDGLAASPARRDEAAAVQKEIDLIREYTS